MSAVEGPGTLLDEWVEAFRGGPEPGDERTAAEVDQVRALVAEYAGQCGVDLGDPVAWSGVVLGLIMPMVISQLIRPGIDPGHPQFFARQVECTGLAQHVVIRNPPAPTVTPAPSCRCRLHTHASMPPGDASLPPRSASGDACRLCDCPTAAGR